MPRVVMILKKHLINIQGSGKSSLLNEMLGTQFPVQPTWAPGTRTTFGALVQIVKGIVAIDLEGNIFFTKLIMHQQNILTFIIMAPRIRTKRLGGA